jgi:hypothetical protein
VRAGRDLAADAFGFDGGVGAADVAVEGDTPSQVDEGRGIGDDGNVVEPRRGALDRQQAVDLRPDRRAGLGVAGNGEADDLGAAGPVEAGSCESGDELLRQRRRLAVRRVDVQVSRSRGEANTSSAKASAATLEAEEWDDTSPR